MNLRIEPYGLELCGILTYSSVSHYMVINMINQTTMIRDDDE